jgi:oligopeptide/dipeptide ABC transporter ATP-binding protein
VAALDVGVQAAVVNLRARLREEVGLTLVFISHNLAVVSQRCDCLAVMYLGRIVESRPTEAVVTDPRHPYTQALLRAQPRLGRVREFVALSGEPPSPLDLPSGCRFHPRCPLAATDPCTTQEPELEGGDGHLAACHFAPK